MKPAGPARIVFLDRNTMPADISLRPFAFPHDLIEFGATEPNQVADRIADADIIITNKAPVRLAELSSAPKLRLIAIAATGSDVVDVKACADRDVAVCNIRNYAVNTVPEHTFALILALRRSLIAYRGSVRAGRWAEAGQFCYFDHPFNDLSGATLGIIGDGAWPRSCRHRASVRNAHAILFLQGRVRHGSPLHAIPRRAAGERRHHVTCP